MATPLTNTLYLGTFIHSKTLTELEYLHSTAIAVDASGTIVAIEPYTPEDNITTTLPTRLGWGASFTTIHAKPDGSQFFFPGFVDTHLHAPQYPNVGLFGASTLLDWLNTYTFPLEASMADLRRARPVYSRVIRKTLAHGTTAAAYYATLDVGATNLLADLCLAAGQRALVGRVCMDSELSPGYYRDASVEEAVRLTRESVEYIEGVDPAGELVRPVVTPRFAPSCTAGLLAALGDMVRERPGVMVQTHISENKGEVELVRELFPGVGSYAEVYDVHGLLTERTILAHAVHLTEGEVELVARRGAKVSHCPCSNSAITSGAARVRWLLEKGVVCGLGTDMSGGYSASVLEAARQAVLVSRHVSLEEGIGGEGVKLSVEEVLYLATRGGAEVIGLGVKVGAFEVGREWDAQLVGLGVVDGEGGVSEGGTDGEEGGVDVFGWESWEEKVAKWVFNGDDRNTRRVWVRGRLVHERK
ncbi:Metallo-dependent hydrolase [Podospora conica]|nr:Metallo-dependent hydrolase [Schizothecium conicum]